MPRKRGPVGKNRVVADAAIVRDVGIGHEQAAAAYRRFSASARRAAAHGHIFAEHIAVADDQFRSLAVKFQIWWVGSDGAERVNHIVLSESGWPMNHGMRVQDAAFPELDIIPNHRVSAYLHARAEFGAWRNHRLRGNCLHGHLAESFAFDGGSRSIILHITVPSAAS